MRARKEACSSCSSWGADGISDRSTPGQQEQRRRDGRDRPASLFCCLLGWAVLIALLFISWAAATTAVVTAAPATNPFEGRGDLVEDGRGLFNQYCAHCHGPNAIQGERPRDLRRLKVRYGQEAPQMYYRAVSHGRMDKGMPVWKGVLTDDVLWRIFTYLQTVQTPP
jgi:mono/diheme cytochrome c family protein